VVAQFVEDFFHLEGGEDGFDQHGGLDRALRQADVILRHDEDVVPQAGFEVAFHLRQVVERAGAAGDLLLGVVEEDQAKSKMPPPRADRRPARAFRRGASRADESAGWRSGR
jgi:hypothetical protein